MEWLFGGGFKRSRLLPNIEAALHRLKIKITSEKAAAAKERKEISALLKGGREELAKIRAEALFSSDNRTEALNILELYLELLRSRVDLLCEEKECPTDLEVTVASICYSQSRVQIAELAVIKEQLKLKYGVKFESICSNPNERLIKCLALTPPSLPVVIRYLEEISASYGVDYTPGDGGCRAPSLPTPPPPSGGGGGGGGSGRGDLYPFVPAPLPGQALPAPTTATAPVPVFAVEVQAVPVNLGIDVLHGSNFTYAAAVGADAGGGGEKVEQDDFEARLAALRK